MKKSIFVLLLSFIAFIPSAFAQNDSPKKAVAVYMTKCDDLEEGYKKVISSTVISKLTQNSMYRVLERMNEFLEAVEASHDFDMSGKVKESSIAAIGKNFGAKFVFVVDATIIGDELFIAGRLINVVTSDVITSAQEFTSGDPSISKVCAMTEKVVNSMIGQGGSSSSGPQYSGSSTGGDVETFTVNGVSFEMVKVGNGLYIGKTEVTQRLWQAVMGNNPSNFLGENRPVEMVSWFDCQEFCDRLSRLTGRIFRLPTEAEWEYAARGGEQPKSYEYSGSNDLYRVAWYDDNSGNSTHPVAQKLPNSLGIYDMTGNVWEWCADTWNSNGSSRVNRGGGWTNIAASCRVANRGCNAPARRFSNLGFRLAL